MSVNNQDDFFEPIEITLIAIKDYIREVGKGYNSVEIVFNKGQKYIGIIYNNWEHYSSCNNEVVIKDYGYLVPTNLFIDITTQRNEKLNTILNGL